MSNGRSCNGRTDSIKYQGFTQTYTTESLQTTITYQSTREALEGNIQATTGAYIPGKWRCGQYYEYGRLDSIHLHDDQGPFWNVDLQFNQPLSSGVTVNFADNKQATQNSLTVRMMSMPIESHPNYRYIWNHILARKGSYQDGQIDVESIADVSGLTVEGAKDLINRSQGNLMWLDEPSQLPTQTWTNQDNPEITESWNIACMYTKPGTNSYDFPTYEIQQNARHTSRNQATWSLLAKNGKLKFPTYGDFGIEDHFYKNIAPSAGSPSGHWLCEGAGINYDGKYYIAACTYLFSPDPFGWDRQMYDVADGGYTVNTKNSIFDH